MEFTHRPVMVREVIRFLNCRSHGIYVDGTVGGGGHALEILKATSPGGVLVGLDRDEEALAAAEKTLKPYGKRVFLVRENFGALKEVLTDLGFAQVDGILLDLGVSSHQLEEPGRGFSFRFDGRLDMRMDTTQELTARDLVNNLEAKDLAAILWKYGEERFSMRIARSIVEARKKKPVETTAELAEIAAAAVPKKFHPRRIHPATKTFQALRIAVNDELGNLERGLKGGMEVLSPGGRFVVISYHSLEDRLVKDAFRRAAAGCVCPPRIPMCVCGKTPSARIVTKKAVPPGAAEIEENPRARSAKLRAVEKL
ncbi:MAG: 16S rRNA (cytosine(1402)-N(4))-methyltransferase RsmH [Thermodesulfobacteriota bacterium]|nr:MAG: 16S rRNA (cytosine(1402)-N(4))-methyltransferase RsmH [Thermodesulfobacteriota bacterium]